MNSTIEININGKIKNYEAGITGLELLKDNIEEYKNYVAFTIDGKIYNLNKSVRKNCKIGFISKSDSIGHKIYINGLKLLTILSVKEVLGRDSDVSFEHSIDKGIYSKVITNKKITLEVIKELEKKMHEYSELDLKISKISVTKSDLSNYYLQTNQIDKLENLRTVTSNYVEIYKCKNSYMYFYSELPISTTFVDKFTLTYLKDNIFVLRFPTTSDINNIPDYVNHEKIINVFNDYGNWIDVMKVYNVGCLNNIVSSGKINEFIRMNEVIQNKQLMKITDSICEKNKKPKMILIAGPSSSGKTTTAHKLCMYLKANGLNPHVLSTDDYFLNRSETPKDENGEYDFETIETIDLKLFNEQLTDLINGREVSIPTFDFIKGEKVYNGRLLKLKENDILVIEGLHTLNEKLTRSIDKDLKVKIYIAPFTPLSIDTYNHIPTTDVRLLRRIVRDNRTRGYTVNDTLKSWKKVRNGEEKYVFPFQDEADYVFNTALIYEIGVLKVYAEPLLFGVSSDSENSEEAKRLLKFLQIFFPIPGDNIPNDSLLREFIGNSCFYE